VQFTYLRGADVKPAYAVFSDRADFPVRPIRNADGTVSKTIKFPLKTGVSYWKASPGQWRAVQALAGMTGTVYWRLEGRSASYKSMTGPARGLYFDTGAINNEAVTPVHDLSGEDGIWPDASTVPVFTWTDNTVGMEYFYVDVSTSPTIPIKDRRATVVVGNGRTAGSTIETPKALWKRIRRFAAANDGELYWRVRAQDRYRALSSAGAVKMLVVDGGEWSVGALDFSAVEPEVTWTHTGEGLVKFNVEISATGDFQKGAKTTVLVPPRAIAASEYKFSAADLRRIGLLAKRNSAATLYYRIRGEDADRQFTAYSAGQSTAAP